MTDFIPTDHPHRRLNILTGEYVLVSPHRTKRPWLGQVEKIPPEDKPAYDPKCYLCPGNDRVGDNSNPDYEETFVFTNDFRALLDDIPAPPAPEDDLFVMEGVEGTGRVICFSPRHDLTLPVMPLPDIRQVIDLWAEQMAELGEKYQWVQVFQNKGPMMGASNPHPHGQIWASTSFPNEPKKEDAQQRAYFQKHGRRLVADYARAELEKEERIIVKNDHWIAVVPFWAVWPYEALLMPVESVKRLPDLGDAQRDALADILKKLLIKYDNLFEVPFPYSMGWHGAPYNDDDNDHWGLHAHFYPPLLRSATVRKFMVGYEMLAEAQRDLTAEGAAAKLRALPDIHYRERGE